MLLTSISIWKSVRVAPGNLKWVIIYLQVFGVVIKISSNIRSFWGGRLLSLVCIKHNCDGVITTLSLDDDKFWLMTFKGWCPASDPECHVSVKSWHMTRHFCLWACLAACSSDFPWQRLQGRTPTRPRKFPSLCRPWGFSSCWAWGASE